MAKELQIKKFQTEAKEMTNMGPLKSTLEHLEFCLHEKTEEFLALQLEFDDLKRDNREKQSELNQVQHLLEQQDLQMESLLKIKEALEIRCDAQTTTFAAMQTQLESEKQYSKQL